MAISLNNLNKLKGLGGSSESAQSAQPATIPATIPANPTTNIIPNGTANAENTANIIPHIPTISDTDNNTASAEPVTITDTNNLDIEISSRLEELSYQLNQAIPDIRSHLMFIHKAMLKDPAQVTLLTPEQKAIYFQSLSKQTRVELVTKAASSSKASKKTANLDIDGFM